MQVAQQEADNSEDTKFVDCVNDSIRQLRHSKWHGVMVFKSIWDLIIIVGLMIYTVEINDKDKQHFFAACCIESSSGKSLKNSTLYHIKLINISEYSKTHINHFLVTNLIIN